MKPSTSRRPSQSTGGKTSGIDMLARTARARSPFAKTTGSPVARSPAIARNGTGRRSKSPPAEYPAGERFSTRKRLTRCSARRPDGRRMLFQSKSTPATDSYRSTLLSTGRVRRSGRPLKSDAQSIDRTICSSCAAVFPVAKIPPTTAPMLLATTASTGIPASSRARRAPTWAMPRAPPPDKARATRGRGRSGARGAGGASWAAETTLEARASPARVRDLLIMDFSC